MTVNTDAIEVSIEIAVDPMTAFTVFTRDIDLWWRKSKEYRFNWRKLGTMQLEPQLGGRVREVYPDGTAFELGKILHWAPPEKLVFEWHSPNYRDDQVTFVEVNFKSIDTGTRATLVHRGWDSLPENHPARHGLRDWDFINLWGGMWKDHLQAIRLVCDAFSNSKSIHK